MTTPNIDTTTPSGKLLFHITGAFAEFERSIIQQRVYAGLYEHVKTLVLGDDSIRGIRLYVDKRIAGAQAAYERLGMNGEHYKVFEWMKEF